MKKSLFMIAGAAAIVFGAVSLQAQQNMAAPRENLRLSAEQQAKYDAIRAASRKKIEAIHQEMKVYIDRIDAVKAEEQAEFEKILTPDQKQVYDAMQAEKKAIMEARKAQAEQMRKEFEASHKPRQ